MGEAVLLHTAALCGLAENPALGSDLLDSFIAMADPELCLDLTDRDGLTLAQARALADQGGADAASRLVRRGLLTAADVDAGAPEVLVALIETTAVPLPWAQVLQRHPDHAVRASLAAVTSAAGVLADLAEDPHLEVVEEVAGSPWLSGELARRLAGHPHLRVRRAVAQNERIHPAVLTALARGAGSPPPERCAGCDSSTQASDWMRCEGTHETAVASVVWALATNPTTPPQDVTALARHAEVYVRWAVARRTDLAQDLYGALAEDPVPGVRGAVAGNPAIGESLMRMLAGDDTYDVRRQLAHNPAVPLEVLAQIAPITKIGPTLLPRIATATGDEIDAMAHAPNPALRMLLAERPDLPPAVCEWLAQDPDAKVLKSLARSNQLSDQQLRAMVSRHGVRVVASVAHNPGCSPELLHELAVHAPPVQKALRVIAARPQATPATLLRCLDDPQARPVAARHPSLPVATILQLLQDPNDQVARAAAANPALPRTAMHKLLRADVGKGSEHTSATERSSQAPAG